MPLKMTLLIAVCLWVRWCGCDVSLETLRAQCDNGKLSLDRDMPAGSDHWDCPVSSWTVSTQEPLSIIDTLYDTEPARQICMDTYISYSQTIPTSGAFRPVRAESGEYLYCPPQRWLNNLHHEAIVLLYHPCIPPHEHLLLSVLARSCLPDYIMTPFIGLNKHTPIVLVSWGRTLELSTMATSAICKWLETTTSLGNKSDDVRRSRNYNLLLTWSAETQQRLAHPEGYPAKLKESLRQCCEQTLSSLLNDVKEAEVQSISKKRSLKQFKEKGKILPIRETLREKQKRHVNENMKESTTDVFSFFSNQNNSDSLNRKGDDEKHNTSHGSSLPPENKIISYPSSRSKAPSHLKNQTVNPSLTPRSTALLASKMPLTALKTVSESQRFRLNQQKAVQESSIRHTGFRGPKLSAKFKFRFDVVKMGHNYTVRRETMALSSKGEGRALLEQSNLQYGKSEERHSDKKNKADGRIKNKEVVYVKEREVEHLQTHSDTDSLNNSETTGSNSIFKSESKSQFHPSFVPQLYPNQQPAGYMPKQFGCKDCQEGDHCKCKDSWIVDKGLPRTPRTEEALWAAAALGFLLVLLTLSVLHTRLYRFWRTSPSLYWHNPKQDYDRVADVIRRRLRFAKRRQQRGKRQECVLLPCSSSSDEHL